MIPWRVSETATNYNHVPSLAKLPSEAWDVTRHYVWLVTEMENPELKVISAISVYVSVDEWLKLYGIGFLLR